MELSARDRARLVGVHPELIRVVEIAASRTFLKWRVNEGLRTPERQKELMADKASMTLNSRHLTGHAVDLLLLKPDGAPDWTFANYHALAAEVLDVACREGVKMRWGGLFRDAKGKRFADGLHFELTGPEYFTAET